MEKTMTDKIEDILAERGAKYGPFEDHARATQDLKTVVYQKLHQNPAYNALDHADKVVINEALDMIAHKIGRIVNGDPAYVDSWDDIAGYAKLASKYFSELVPF
jgi:uncharacterized protein (UPF0297 family)